MDDLWHDQNENTRLKESIHPRIDAFLNEQYHFNYRGLLTNALQHSWVNKAINSLFAMSGTRATPLLATQAQNAADATDIVNMQFVRSSLPAGTNASSNANLVNSLRSALMEAEVPADDINDTLKNFDPSCTISEYYAVQNNVAIVKSKGFPSFASLQGFVKDMTAKNHKEKTWTLSVTPRFVIALIK